MQVVGTELFEKDPRKLLEKLEMTNEEDINELKQKLRKLRKNPSGSFSSSFSNSMLSLSSLQQHFTGKEQQSDDTDTGDDECQQQQQQAHNKKVRFDKCTFFHSENRDRVTVKCTYGGMNSGLTIPHICLVPPLPSPPCPLF